MFKGLHARLTISFVFAASSILIFASVIIMLEVHYHLNMFKEEAPDFKSISPITHHFESALLNSILWTSLGAILLVCIISYFVARNLSLPLIQMRKVAEKMAKGDLDVRVNTLGNDEVNELGISLNQLASQLQQQEKARKNMTSDIAHELRTPLATIKSHLEAFEDGVFQPTPNRIHSLKEEIERLIHLVQDLEHLNEIESPNAVNKLHRENLNKVINRSIEAVSGAYAKKGVMINSDLNESPIYIMMDSKRITQVLFNLLTNSLAYSPANGIVTIRARNEQNNVHVMIKDSGIGIPKEEVEKVFERFYRSEKSRNRDFGGSGIGLTIVKRIVEAHGGQIWIESEVGKGTEVHIKFYN
jgi:two-component system, OmpR family, sensor histidine kinase BaeS